MTGFFLTILLVPRVGALFFNINVPKNSDTYGPYKFACKVHVCHTASPTTTTLDMKIEDSMLKINVSFPITIRIDQMRILFYTVKNDQKFQLVDYKIDKPCQHDTIGGAFRAYMKGNRDCIVKKSSHYFEMVIEDTIRNFYGSSFFYGMYASKVTVLTKKKVVMCGAFDLTFSKA